MIDFFDASGADYPELYSFFLCKGCVTAVVMYMKNFRHSDFVVIVNIVLGEHTDLLWMRSVVRL